jgi:uncharacterized protein YeeX (DUF496 family)
MSELNELRAEARRRHKAATAKVSRLKRAKGADISGTQLDVRRDLGKVKRYTAKQLQAYITQLNNFTSRNTTYLGSAGAPLQGTRVNELQRLVRQYNKIGSEHYGRVADTFVPSSGMTIKERHENVRDSRKRARGEGAQQPYVYTEINPAHINGPGALEKLIKDYKRKTSQTYNDREVSKARRSVDKMLKEIGVSEISDKFKGLSNHQFDVLWNYVDFAKDIVSEYVKAQMRNTSREDDLTAALENDGNLNALTDIIDWAHTLPTKPTPGRRKKG